MIENGDALIRSIPPIAGEHLRLRDLFDLYCYDIGKPHSLLCFYQSNYLVDYQALQWVKDIPALRGLKRSDNER